MEQTDIINAIEAHAKEFGLKTTTIGQLAVKSRHAYDRIKAGRAHRKTESDIMSWLKADRAKRTKVASQ